MTPGILMPMRRLLPLLLGLPLSAPGQEPELRRAEVAAVPTGPSAPASLSQSERRILRNVDSMTLPQLQEMVEVYSRLGNRRMANALTSRVLQRDPANARAQELVTEPGDADEPDDPDLAAAEEFMRSAQPAKAALAYQKIKAAKYAGKPFPWQEDLAFALYESGDTEGARRAFTELAGTASATAASTAEARRMLRSIELDSLSSGNDPAAMLRAAGPLLAANPDDPDGIALKARALSLQGKPREAVDFLQKRKAASKTPAFAQESLLGDAFYEARMFDNAKASYQSILTTPGFTAEEQSDATARMKDLERDSLLIAGEHSLRTRRMDEAVVILDQLKHSSPGHPDVSGFEAAVMLRQKRFAKARDLLMILRDSAGRSGNFFDSRPDLAWACVNSGDWEGAVSEFAQIEGDTRFDTAARYDAARMKREIRQRYRPAASLSIDASDEAEGNSLAAHSELSTGFLGDTRSLIIIRSSWDNVKLADTRVLNRSDMDRYQAEVAWQKVIGKGFFGEVSAGASRNDVVTGARFGRYEQSTPAWEFYYRGNDRADDSLPLIALDGRQTAFGFLVRRSFGDRFSLDARAQYRQVDVHEHRLGTGLDLDFTAGWTLLTQTTTRPEVTLNYFAELQRFNRGNLPDGFAESVIRSSADGMTGADLSSSLIDERINRHGLTLTMAKQFSPKLSGYVYGGVSRKFENATLEGRAGAGLETFIGENAALILGLDYATSGNTGNTGSDVWSASAAVRVSF